MKIAINVPKIMALEAFERLKMWFDPAMDGSPYEVSMPQNKQRGKKRYPFVPRKLSMRM